ncbi:MAG: hypothetical protein EA380_00340 [Phycisphaeraceae bacterium]|nr:MAG: hypothetical protein EA380_00340 [Phycisphaeraceae bacterium]
MQYWTNLFSPATYEAFSKSDQTISGFRESQKSMAAKVKAGDVFLCYMTKTSRWIGAFEILEGPFIDRTPIFVPEEDPFVVRFRVQPRIWLARDHTVPIQHPPIWDRLSFTKDCPPGSPGWIGPLRRSLHRMLEEDGSCLISVLSDQASSPVEFPIAEEEWRRHLPGKAVRGDARVVDVTVPQESEDTELEQLTSTTRESALVQAKLAQIGENMGFSIWIPKADRGAVLSHWSPRQGVLFDVLPMNYDETTIKTIENIDVLWLRGRAIARAFEVEHTTAIYSGLLRMADLLALQPNMDIRLHIVAPDSRKGKVFTEIRRPVFSLLDRAPLYECCTFISYESLEELASSPHLKHLSDTVLEDFAEVTE